MKGCGGDRVITGTVSPQGQDRGAAHVGEAPSFHQLAHVPVAYLSLDLDVDGLSDLLTGPLGRGDGRGGVPFAADRCLGPFTRAASATAIQGGWTGALNAASRIRGVQSAPSSGGYVMHLQTEEAHLRAPIDLESARATPKPTFEPVTTARLALAGRPLARIEDAVVIGEITRLAALAKLGRDDPPPDAMSVLSGHNMGGGNVHTHAFYLPEFDEDGRIDRVLVHAAAGLDADALNALGRIRRLYHRGDNEWKAFLESYGSAETLPGHPYLAPGRHWVSVTPYLHPWFVKKGLTVEGQILRECELRGLPAPTVHHLEDISVPGRVMPRRATDFRRWRLRKGPARQPDRRGSFWRLTFPSPVNGPVALGFACHYGLGLFRSEDSSRA